MIDEELIARADANYYESMRIIAPALGDGEVRERGGLLLAATGLPVAFLNIAFVTRPLRDPEALIRQAVAFFAERKLPYILRARENLDSTAERAAAACGLHYSDTVPGMVLHPMSSTARRSAPLEIRRVEDMEALETYAEVLAGGFDMPPELGRRFVAEQLLGIPDSHLYLGYAEGRPVATSALVMSHRVAGVYNVATLPAYRRRGFGEAMTWYAVEEGAEAGCLMASLQSSEMGYPVYERMGFRRITGYRTYIATQK